MHNDSWNAFYLFSLCIIISLVLTGVLYPASVYSAPVPPIHNSDRFACNLSVYHTEEDCNNNGGIWDFSRKWDYGWGSNEYPGQQQYGNFTCGTCHVRKPANGNIKRIRPSITAPDGSLGSFPGSEVIAQEAIPDVSSDFGDDSNNHTDSKSICEVCHQKTRYHRFDTTVVVVNGSTLDHFNNADCISCHRHKAGFRAGCSDCHGNSTTGEAWPDGLDNNVNPKYADFDIAGSHARHAEASGGNSSCNLCHPLPESGVTHLDTTLQVLEDSFSYTQGSQDCSNITCHAGTGARWGTTGCLGCHSVVQGNRVAVEGQFSSNSHHIQAGQVTDAHCYQCHWEANSDGTISAYHGGSNATSAPVDLVIYGVGARPLTYSEGITALRYTADGSRSEITQINNHCLGCHSDQNNDTLPFGDDKTPNQYAWDGTSVASRYSQSGSTNLGKYPTVANAAQKIQTKAYSAHGNATLNEGGWSTSTGVDGTLPNTRNGSVIVACYDCHNSHGSSVAGKTTSYASATPSGGILKDTRAGEGGYVATYQPVAGGTAENKNIRNPGASLCMDCHLTADGGSSLPWGYKSTYGATEQIIGYYDSPSFSPGPAGTKVRYPYRAASDFKGGHFGASSGLETPAMASINGLCTPCHDPHGVSSTLDDASTSLVDEQQYGIPLLKGTWLTSPYKEDTPPQTNSTRTVQRNDRHVYIDGTTFGSHIKQLVKGINETDQQFAGLCLHCHPKSSLADGVTHTWKSKDRVHEAVSGWDSSGFTKHYFTCSKCHTPHMGSALPRLMVTNCMDSSHKGRVVNEPSPAIEDLGTWWDEASYSGKCGEGRIPGSHTDCGGTWTPVNNTFACHEEQNGYANQGTDQSWNALTPWAPDFYVKPLPYVTNTAKSTTFTGKVRFYARWGTNLASDSAVDYGLTPSYGQTVSGTNLVTNHILLLDGLDNHNTYYYQVRSSTTGGDQLAFGYEANQSYYISVPPDRVSLITQASQVCTDVSTNVNLSWNATLDVDGGPIEYLVEVNDSTSFYSPKVTSGWTSETTVTVGPLDCNKTWYWQVKARDAEHIEAESYWSVRGSFDLGPYPSKPATPTLYNEPDFECGGNCSARLSWPSVSNPYPNLYGPIQYFLEVDDDPLFSSPDRIRDWATTTYTDITGLAGDKTWYWRLKARYTNYPDDPALESDWSLYDDFTTIYPSPGTPTALFTLDVVSPSVATLTWTQAAAYNSGTVEYALRVDDDPGFTTIDYSDSWISGTSATTGTLGVGTWYWQVKARDVDHPSAESDWSNTSEFRVYATAPTSKTITFTWTDVPFGSITIDGVPYGGPAASVDVVVTDSFTAEIVGAPGQAGGGEPSSWEYYASQAPGGNPGSMAAVFTPNDGNVFTVNVGATPPYRDTGGAGGGASYVAKDDSTVMYAAGAGGGGGGEASYLDGEEFDGEVFTWKERGANGFPGESFDSATGGAGGAGSTSTSGTGVAGSPGGDGGSGSVSATPTTISGDVTIPRVTIVLRGLPGPAVPTLDWTGESNYVTDGVDPESGAQLTNFTFRVEYTDADNDSPWPIEVWIDVDDNDSYAEDEKFAMSELDSGDTDYTDGKLYTFSKALSFAGDGLLKYRFYASDFGTAATGAPASDLTLEIINNPPVTPSNATPLNGASDVLQPPTLIASAFANTAVDAAAGDSHQASQWLISYGSENYDSGPVAATNRHVADIPWSPATTYSWQVRYQDNHGEWSAYSAATSFTTLNNHIPDQPINGSPAAGEVNVDLQPLLSASAFADADSDTHQASRWQVSLADGARFDAAIVYDSGAVGATTSHTLNVPLSSNNQYFWRVRYQDSVGQWSAWSSETGFFVPTSLVSMFPFDNDSGLVAEDIFGSNNGDIRNGALLSAGFSGQGLTFDGLDDNVLWSYAEGVPVNNFTIEAMVKTSDTHEIDPESPSSTAGISGQKYLFGAQHHGVDGGAGISVGTNGISVYEHGDSYMPPLAVYANDIGTDWNHIVVTYMNKQPRIYLNGKLVHTGLTSTKANVYAPIQLGGGSYGYFNGSVDEVSIYDSALTKEEIMQHCIAVGQCTPGDLDSDGVADSSDNCIFDYNPSQQDLDNNGIGNVCEYVVSRWKFDEGAGAIAQDDTLYNIDGQLLGGTTWTTGKVGGAVDFDGVTGYVSISDTPIHHFGTGSFTIETWINTSSFTSTDDPNIVRWFSKSAWCSTWSTDPSCKWFVGQITSTGHPQFSGRGYNDSSGFSHTAPGTISLNTWHHIAYVIDRSSTPAKGFIYIDGVNQSGTGVELTQLNGELNIPAPITLGGTYADLTGKLDQTAIYANALSAEEILDHFQNP